MEERRGQRHLLGKKWERKQRVCRLPGRLGEAISWGEGQRSGFLAAAHKNPQGRFTDQNYICEKKKMTLSFFS